MCQQNKGTEHLIYNLYRNNFGPRLCCKVIIYFIRIILRDIHEQKLFLMIWHCRSQLKNVGSSGIWIRIFGIPVLNDYQKRSHMQSFPALSTLQNRAFQKQKIRERQSRFFTAVLNSVNLLTFQNFILEGLLLRRNLVFEWSHSC